MIKFFFKIFGIILAILAAVGIVIAGVIFAFACNAIAGVITLVLGISGFVAALITAVEYSTRFWW